MQPLKAVGTKYLVCPWDNGDEVYICKCGNPIWDLAGKTATTKHWACEGCKYPLPLDEYRVFATISPRDIKKIQKTLPSIILAIDPWRKKAEITDPQKGGSNVYDVSWKYTNDNIIMQNAFVRYVTEIVARKNPHRSIVVNIEDIK